jgi:hypothetical protein
VTLGVSAGGKTNALAGDFYSSDKTGAGIPFLGISRGLFLKKTVRTMTADAFENGQRADNPFATGFSVNKRRATPAIGLDLGAGKALTLGSHKLNLLLAAGFNNEYTVDKDAYVSTVNAQGVIRDQYDYDKYAYETTATLLGQLGYAGERAGSLAYTLLFIHNTEDSYMRREGTDAEGMELTGSNSAYHARQLFTHQLTGKHALMRNRLLADWQASYGQTAGKEPDRRQVMFVKNGDGGLSLFKLNRQETMRYFGELSEEEGNADLKLKLLLGNDALQPHFIRAGGSMRRKTRDFYSVNFYYNLKNISPRVEDIYQVDDFLSYQAVADGRITVSKNSLPRNTYYAGSDLDAAFVDMEYYPAPALLVSAGVRYERFRQWTRFWTDAAQEKRAELAADDLFPALNIRYAVAGNDNLRLGLSRTVTRPSFLEMAPFEYKESYGGATIRGYEAIRNGYNYNADLRYERFYGFGDMYSLGVFYKRLQTPIERVQEYAGSLIQSFRNVDGGVVWGAELEARRQVTAHLKIDFNASFIHTRISLPEQGLYTDRKRPLQGASPYLLNVDASYTLPAPGLSVSAVYNLQGPRISSVGINQVNNVVEEALHSAGVTVLYQLPRGMKLKLQAKNLLNAQHTFTQKIKDTKETVEYFRQGIDIAIGFSIDLYE